MGIVINDDMVDKNPVSDMNKEDKKRLKKK